MLPGLAIAALALLGTLFLSQRRAPDVAERVEPPRPAPAAVAQPTPVTQAPTPPPAPEPSPTPAASPREAAPATPGFLAQLGQYLEGGAAKPRRFVFENLTFAAGSAELTESSREMVDGVASLLKGHPSARIVVEGFTDNSGSAAANTELSQRRAEAVKEALVQGGVDADRIEAQGHGPERPIASNTIADGRARNRRTELVVSAR